MTRVFFGKGPSLAAAAFSGVCYRDPCDKAGEGTGPKIKVPSAASSTFYRKAGDHMGLEPLTGRIYYEPHRPDLDQPMLGYIRGNRFSLAVDAGYSERPVCDFYGHLAEAGLKKPDFTVLTHWHYDHTFGMRHIHGVSIAHCKTNEFQKELWKKAADGDYVAALKREDQHFAKE